MRSDRYKEETKTSQKPKKKSRTLLKVLLVLILLLAVAVPASVYYSYKSAEDSLALTFKDDNAKYEIGAMVSSEDLIASSEGDVKASEESLDTDTAGDKKLSYTVKKSLFGGLLEPEKEFTYHYSVEDRTPPLMLWSGEGAVVVTGDKFDIKSVVGYGDNADPSPKIEYTGKVDTGKPGDYPLHVTVTDASGNSTDWDTSITVADTVPSYHDDSPRTKFSDFISTYKADGRHFGIDVSEWQGDIDFEAVKKAGCEFVIMRAGFSMDGKVTADATFKKNYEGAKKAGLKIGLYLFSYDNTEELARNSAKWVIDQLGGDSLDLPVAFDWEDFGQFQTHDMSFIGLNRLYDAFADELNKAGYDCMLYGSKNYLEKIWEDTDTRPVWLAHYADSTDYKNPYRIWQASCTGRIDGIGGDVDMNIMYD